MMTVTAYQRDLVVSLVRAAKVEPNHRVVHLRRAVGILRELQATARLHPEQVEWIPRLEAALKGTTS
jgi:hypothetical protein